MIEQCDVVIGSAVSGCVRIVVTGIAKQQYQCHATRTKGARGDCDLLSKRKYDDQRHDDWGVLRDGRQERNGRRTSTSSIHAIFCRTRETYEFG
jgi:hypothetical protein